MTLHLASHNGLLAIDEPWHNRDSPEFGEEGIPYIELRKTGEGGGGHSRFTDYWDPCKDSHTLEGFLRAIEEMIDLGRIPRNFYTHARLPNGCVIELL